MALRRSFNRIRSCMKCISLHPHCQVCSKRCSRNQNILDLLLIHEPDVVITNTCVNILPAVAAKKLGIPVIWIIAETIQLNESTVLTVGLVDQYSDWIVGISHATL
ncbi:hypothetical protein M5X11_25665 [Paenibacillus alginolyticus]|uniref:hypothetical protein n=1 Tax=Paenibacillus alginolyticus TaxID=59839 RepID=UPI000FD72D1D|nr:hypothetical protein [Paenibacillus alginolyticus]MCY9668269.1 hypothetical protein [Paenibacillus alginolyticus]